MVNELILPTSKLSHGHFTGEPSIQPVALAHPFDYFRYCLQPMAFATASLSKAAGLSGGNRTFTLERVAEIKILLGAKTILHEQTCFDLERCGT